MTEENQDRQEGDADFGGEAGASEQEAQSWFWSEDVPGVGPRPDYLPEKFKSVADAAKARSDLEKKLGSFTGAPEEYKLDHLEIDTEQHSLKEITGWAKENNLNQKGLEGLIGKLLSAQEAENSVDLEKEVESLGEEGPRLMRQYKNFRDNHLQGEEQELVKGWIKSANDLKVFNDLVKGIYAKRLPTDNSMYLANTNDTNESIKAEMAKNIERYNKDETYRKDIRSRFDRVRKISERGGDGMM